MNITIKTLFYCVFSALLFTLSFPGYGYDFLIWFSLIPLFTIITASEKKFTTGLCAGTIIYTSSLVWLVPTISNYGGLPFISSFAAIVLLGFYLGIYTGIFAFLFPDITKKPLISVFLIPALWTGLDFISSFLFSGFPWVFAGYSQYKNSYLIQISSIFGVYGITFYIVFINTGMFILFKSIFRRRNFYTPANITLCVLLAGATSAAGIFGSYNLDKTKAIMDKSLNKKIAIVQPNIPPETKKGKDIKTTLEKHIETSNLIKEEFDLGVWPETALPYPIVLDKKILSSINKFTEKKGNFLVGFLDLKKNNSEYLLKNRAALFPYKKELQFYDKIHLVPFGEYIPLKKHFPFLSKFIVPSGEFKAGEKNLPLVMGEIKAGIKICFEIIFPNLVRKQVKNGANIIINLTNDAWFGKTAGPHQHLAISAIRAVENKRAIARCANTGISAHILPTGEIISRTLLFETKSIVENLPLIEEKTMYTKYGDFFAYTCTFVLLFYGFLFYFKRKKEN
ncbi:MAG: apolipoprotein N-acyltransferase [Desulforegulaceae bacterium]|nr:apolipoprotein N-acyltransferase [Desulforegulaceae bacterium]